MSEFFAGQLDFTFNAEVKGEEVTAGKWNWASAVFGDPLSLPPRLQTKWQPQSEDSEASLYSDWQTRDTELGYRLLEPRVPQFKLTIHCYRSGLLKRQRAIPLIRTRLETIEKINEAEPNPLLRHPAEVINGMKQEITEATEEFEYLRNF